MILTRRRFLTISAAAGLARPATAASWRGTALGAEATISISGGLAGQAMNALRDTLRRIEESFSLFDPGSALSRLNASGEEEMPLDFQRLWPDVVAAHELTDGLFDPTIQPRWQHLAGGGTGTPRSSFNGVQVAGRRVSLPAGGAMTLNGIAQGYATDRAFKLLTVMGFSAVTVNIGEFRTGADGARLAIAGPDRNLARVSLRDGAIATSSPEALLIGRVPHILHPWDTDFRPRWRTVSVESATASLADALSTALCLTPDTLLARKLKSGGEIRRAWMEDSDGALIVI